MSDTELLRELELVDAAVPVTATFSDAARTLCRTGVPAVAVLDDKRRVRGLFTQDDLVAALFPTYLDELRHTAFLDRHVDPLLERAREVGAEPVARHMRAPIVVEARSSAIHVAERFLHCEPGAIAVVEDDRFVGIVRQTDFCRLLLQRVSGRDHAG